MNSQSQHGKSPAIQTQINRQPSQAQSLSIKEINYQGHPTTTVGQAL
jgi:hypothetical protein